VVRPVRVVCWEAPQELRLRAQLRALERA
jgi:hypothetical protein